MASFFRFLKRRPIFSDGEIELVLGNDDCSDEECGILDGFLFRIYHCETREYTGYVSLRLGESPALYYLGHIGYRIEEKYRGHGYAFAACKLIKPFIQKLCLESVVITTDTDNIASRKTCEHLECELECISPVPLAYRKLCSGSRAKCRYIWKLDQA